MTDQDKVIEMNPAFCSCVVQNYNIMLLTFSYALGGHHGGADLWRRLGLGRRRHDGPPRPAEEVTLSALPFQNIKKQV